MSYFDWRGTLTQVSERKLTEELRGSTVLEVTPSGVIVMKPDGEKVALGAAGYDYDMEVNSAE